MLRKKFFKFLSVLVAITVTSVPFFFSASAETTTTDFFDFFSPTVTIYHWSGTEVTSDLTSNFGVSFSDNTMELWANNNSSLPSGSWILVSCKFLLQEPFNKSGFSSGRFSITNYASRYTFSIAESDVNLAVRRNYSGDFFNGNITTGGSRLDVYFPENEQQTAFQYIELDFVITTQIDLINGHRLPFYFSDLEFSYTNPTQEITDSISQNTDKITNGWQSSGGLDTSVSDDFHNKENEILNNTLNGRNDSISLFNNFGSLFTTGYFFNGVTAVSRILTKFIQIDWLSGLLQLSLSVGIFAFLIGSIQLVGSKISRSHSTKGGKE